MLNSTEKQLKKYRVTCDIISATLTAVVEAENEDEAKELFDSLAPDEVIEEPATERFDNYEVEKLCDICNQPEDEDGRCHCTNEDAN